MAKTPFRLIQQNIEFLSQAQINSLPKGIRGIYALFKSDSKEEIFDVQYIGMSSKDVRKRLASHRRNKGTEWSHFSVFGVGDKIEDQLIKELEGILRHIYRYHQTVNLLNKLNSYKGFKKVPKIELRQ